MTDLELKRMKLIPSDRFHAAAHRLAIRRFECALRTDDRYLELSPAEASELLLHVLVPWAFASLANRLWKRGHAILDTQTREISRAP